MGWGSSPSLVALMLGVFATLLAVVGYALWAYARYNVQKSLRELPRKLNAKYPGQCYYIVPAFAYKGADRPLLGALAVMKDRIHFDTPSHKGAFDLPYKEISEVQLGPSEDPNAQGVLRMVRVTHNGEPRDFGVAPAHEADLQKVFSFVGLRPKASGAA